MTTKSTNKRYDFTLDQQKILEAKYAQVPHPSMQERQAIATEFQKSTTEVSAGLARFYFMLKNSRLTNMTFPHPQVSYWFENARRRDAKKKSE